MWSNAIQDAVEKIRKNMDAFGSRFPHVSRDGAYLLNDNDDWTNGFWSGLLWLCYEYTGDEAFRLGAKRTVEDFRRRFAEKKVLDHHDIGFLYSLSSKAEWIIEKDESARQLTLQAADLLLKRWRPSGGYIQAWGPEGDEQEGGRIIIDCLMNLPLLFWAGQQTGKPTIGKLQSCRRRNKAISGTGRRQLIPYLFFDPHSGSRSAVPPIKAIRTVRPGRGAKHGGIWIRAGLSIHRRSRLPGYFKRMARYFLKHLPEDHVALWDFNAPVTAETYRDSSASAIVAAGLLELIGHLEEEDPDRAGFEQGLKDSMTSLVRHYSTIGQEAEGLLQHGSYHVRGGLSPDDFMIWEIIFTWKL